MTLSENTIVGKYAGGGGGGGAHRNTPGVGFDSSVKICQDG